jgi:hypothetical protein
LKTCQELALRKRRREGKEGLEKVAVKVERAKKKGSA